MRKLSMIIISGLALAAAGSASAQPAAPTAQPAAPTAPAAPAAPASATVKLSSDSTVRALLANPATKAILQKHVPLIVEHAPEYPEIYDMTLKALSGLTEAQTMGGLTPDLFKKIEADLAAL